MSLTYNPIISTFFDEYQTEIAQLLQIADIGIEDFKQEKIPRILRDIEQPVDIGVSRDSILTAGKENLPTEYVIDIATYHKKFRKGEELTKPAKFDLLEESKGTQHFFGLAVPLLLTFKTGGILVIDELDASLHPLLLHEIVKLFNSPANKKNAQLIFNTHDVTLLMKNLLRRDQIWFTEKNPQGASELYSLVDFKIETESGEQKVRKDASYLKDYLLGKYGAIPYLKDFAESLGALGHD